MDKYSSSKSKKICDSIEIHTLVKPRVLIGYEEHPRFFSWGSFMGYRKMKENELDKRIDLNNNKVIGKRFNSTQLKEGEKKEEKVESNDDHSNKPFECILDTSLYQSRSPMIFENIPDYDNIRGDTSVWCKLVMDTKYSGIDHIDEKESEYVTRNTQNGLCQIELFDIFKAYCKKCSEGKINVKNNKSNNQSIFIESAFLAPKVMKIEVNKLINRYTQKRINIDQNAEKLILQEAFDLSHYGVVHFEIKIHGFNYDNYKSSILGIDNLKETQTHSFINTNKNLSSNGGGGGGGGGPNKSSWNFNPILYNSQKGMKIIRGTMENILLEYCKSYVYLDGVAPKYPPINGNVANLQMPQYVCEQGDLPVHCFWTSMDPSTREYYDENIKIMEQKYYSFDEKTEGYFLMMALASLNRYGLSRDTLIKEIKNHYSESNTSTKATDTFLLCQEAILDIGTFIGNMIYYTPDYRYVITKDNNNKQSSISKSNFGNEINNTNVKVRSSRLMLDSFDSPALLGWSGSGDCEDSCQTATMVIKAYGFGRYNYKNKWESELLNTIKMWIDNNVIFYNGGTVTSAYMDTSGKPVDMKDKTIDLPLRGTPMDDNSVSDGHCYGSCESLSKCKILLRNGNVDKKIIDRIILANNTKSFISRDTGLEMSIIEGTGSIKSHILATEESYNQYPITLEKETSERHFMKSFKIAMTEFDKLNSNNSKFKVMDLVNMEGLPYYLKEQDHKRRVSSFFDRSIHGVTMDLMKYDKSLTQFAFCKKVGNKKMYGVPMGELIRDSLKGDISLISPYVNSDIKLKNDTIQMIESTQNQTPIMSFGRYEENEYNVLYSRFIPFDKIHQLNDKNINYDNESKLFQQKISSVSNNPNLTIIHFDSRLWKLNSNKENTQNFKKVILSMKGIIDIGIYEHKFIPVLDQRIEILCIIDVKKAMENVINQ